MVSFSSIHVRFIMDSYISISKPPDNDFGFFSRDSGFRIDANVTSYGEEPGSLNVSGSTTNLREILTDLNRFQSHLLLL